MAINVDQMTHQVAIVLGIIANHMAEVCRHVRIFDCIDAQDFFVSITEDLLGVGFTPGVNPLIKGTKNDLPKVEGPSVSNSGGDEFFHELTRDGTTVLVVARHFSQRLLFPDPIFQHLARSFHEISLHPQECESWSLSLRADVMHHMPKLMKECFHFIMV